jgi:hypothetical protein
MSFRTLSGTISMSGRDDEGTTAGLAEDGKAVVRGAGTGAVMGAGRVGISAEVAGLAASGASGVLSCAEVAATCADGAIALLAAAGDVDEAISGAAEADAVFFRCLFFISATSSLKLLNSARTAFKPSSLDFCCAFRGGIMTPCDIRLLMSKCVKITLSTSSTSLIFQITRFSVCIHYLCSHAKSNWPTSSRPHGVPRWDLKARLASLYWPMKNDDTA